MTRRGLAWSVLVVLLGGCRVASLSSQSTREVSWWSLAEEALSGLPEPETSRSAAGVLHVVADGTDPRLPVPLEDRAVGQPFIALLAATRPEDLPDDLPGLPHLLARVGLEARGASDETAERAAVAAFSMGWSLRPLVTEQALGWLAVLPAGAADRTVMAAASLLAHLAERPSFSVSDVAQCAETLLVTPAPEGPGAELAARAAGFRTAVAAWPTGDALMRVHREDLVRLHRRVFTPGRLVLAGSQPWPSEVRERLDRLADPADGAGTAGAPGLPDEPGAEPDDGPGQSPVLQVDEAGWFALPVASLPGWLRASGTALRGPVRAQVVQLLGWLRASGWVEGVTLRTVGGRLGDTEEKDTHDVLTGHVAQLESLSAVLNEFGDTLGTALAPLDGDQGGPLVPALRAWVLTLMPPSGADP